MVFKNWLSFQREQNKMIKNSIKHLKIQIISNNKKTHKILIIIKFQSQYNKINKQSIKMPVK